MPDICRVHNGNCFQQPVILVMENIYSVTPDCDGKCWHIDCGIAKKYRWQGIGNVCEGGGGAI